MRERAEVRERAQVAARGQRPVERHDPHLDPGLAHGLRLSVRPDAPGRIGGPRVVLRDDGDAHQCPYTRRRIAAWAAATLAIGTRNGEQLT